MKDYTQENPPVPVTEKTAAMLQDHFDEQLDAILKVAIQRMAPYLCGRVFRKPPGTPISEFPDGTPENLAAVVIQHMETHLWADLESIRNGSIEEGMPGYLRTLHRQHKERAKRLGVEP
jgi:hypothetical protein